MRVWAHLDPRTAPKKLIKFTSFLVCSFVEIWYFHDLGFFNNKKTTKCIKFISFLGATCDAKCVHTPTFYTTTLIILDWVV